MSNGRYERRKLLGDGGMGEVWRCLDTELGREVAVKVPLQRLARDPMFVERFRREARAMAKIDHDNVIRIYDVLDSPGKLGIVMEYVPGGSLADLLSRRKRLRPEETMSIVTQAARALAAAHRRGIIHRDVKPANLLLRHREDDDRGPGGRISIALTDFGIAQTPTANLLTQPGQHLGTVSYMAPELFEGAAASAQSDIYSLGIVAYECLTGRTPFPAGHAGAVADMHRKKPPPLPQHVPAPLRRIVERAMAKEPNRRYASAADLANAIETAVAGRAPDPRAPRAAVARPGPRGAGPAGTVRQRRPDPTRVAAPERRGGFRWLLAILAVAATGAAGTAAVQLYRDRNDDAGHVVPADVRAFAPRWPLDRCVDFGHDKGQVKRWKCVIDDSTSLILIRYEPGDHRDAKRAENDDMSTRAGGVRLRRGTVTAPGGATGLYREYEVNIEGEGWQDEIWFDNYPVREPPLALLLRTPRDPNTRAAVDRIRRLWTDTGYTLPA